MLAAIKYVINNNEAGNILPSTSSTASLSPACQSMPWATKFGGSAVNLAEMMESSYKIGIGFSSDQATRNGGGGLFQPISRAYAQLTIDRSMLPQERFGTMQWVDTTLAHELFGHAMSASVGMHHDVGRIMPACLSSMGFSLERPTECGLRIITAPKRAFLHVVTTTRRETTFLPLSHRQP